MKYGDLKLKDIIDTCDNLPEDYCPYCELNPICSHINMSGIKKLLNSEFDMDDVQKVIHGEARTYTVPRSKAEVKKYER